MILYIFTKYGSRGYRASTCLILSTSFCLSLSRHTYSFTWATCLILSYMPIFSSKHYIIGVEKKSTVLYYVLCINAFLAINNLKSKPLKMFDFLKKPVLARKKLQYPGMQNIPFYESINHLSILHHKHNLCILISLHHTQADINAWSASKLSLPNLSASHDVLKKNSTKDSIC